MFLARMTFVLLGCVTGCDTNAIETSFDAGSGKDGDGESRTSSRDAADESSGANDAAPELFIEPGQFTEEHLPLRMLAEGDRVELWAAPQGGRVVLIGARVKNLTSDRILLRVRVGYPDTSFIIAEEARTVQMVPVPEQAGTTEPDLTSRSHVAHVPLCPNYDPFDIVDRPLEITVQVTALFTNTSQMGEVKLRAVPTCLSGAPSESTCRCECQANYALGKCKPDGGISQ